MENLKLSIFFNSDRVYLLVGEPTEQGINLIYVNSTEHPIDLESPDSHQSKLAIKELQSIFTTFDFTISNISVSLAADTILVSQLPGKPNMSNDDIRQLVSMEIRQAFPLYSADDFSSSIIPTQPDLSSKTNMVAIIIPNIIKNNCIEILAMLNAPIVKFEISQINNHQAFIYNYPEYQGLCIAFFSVQDQFIDISLVDGDKIFYYNLISINKGDNLGEICSKELFTFAKNFNQSIDYGVFLGSGLTAAMLKEAKTSLKNVIPEIDKLNAFRMVKATISDRAREYCSRTSHIFPPCIGGFMPFVSNEIKL